MQFAGLGSLSLLRLCWHRRPHRWIFLPVYLLWIFLPDEVTSYIPYANHYDRPRLVHHKLIDIPLDLSLIYLGAAYIVLNPEYAKPTHRGARTQVFIGL